MLSSETIHATTIAVHGHAIMIVGPSGSGKSDLALRLIDRGARLVSDDYTIVTRTGTIAKARAPETIKNKIEVRGVGIAAYDSLQDVPVIAVIDLTEPIDRLPTLEAKRIIAGIELPLFGIRPFEASAPVKVELLLKLLVKT